MRFSGSFGLRPLFPRVSLTTYVSQTEFNLQETLSTLKYANRARYIKNRADINETEAGWDDLEHLQRTIVKLRAEMAALKSGDVAHVVDRNGHAEVAVPGSVEAELQQKVAHLTAELAKAQSGELAAPGSPSPSSLSRDQFAAAVEPIVEEYERSLSALESQLALTKAALGHSEDEMRDLEARIEEEARTNEANTALIDELRLRVAKLSEREETTEQYVRDLESRLKDVDDADESHGVAISDLRKELVRNREAAQSTDLYIKELEGRLAQADEANADLRRQIESLEREVARREESYRELEARVTLLDTSHDSKLLLAEIDDKDRRLHDLERSVDELKSKVDAAEEEAQRLHKLASEEKAVKEELLGRVRTLERTRSNMGPAMTPPRTPGSSSVESSSPEAADVTTSRDAGVLAAHVPLSAGASTDDNLRQQIASLQSTHEQTLRDLEAAQQKYRDSLKEIDDLNGQIQESRLLQTRRSESDFSEMDSHAARGKPGGEEDGAGDAVEQLTDSPTSPRTGSPVVQRPAARTPHARRSMPLSPQRLSFLGRGQGASSPSHLRSASLAQELSSAVFSQTSCPTSPHTVSSSSTSHIRRDSFFGQSERSSEQMKEEVLKLQSALDERDAEIATLEATVQQLRTPDPSGAPSPLRSAGMPLPSIVTERPATPPPDERSTPPSEVLLSPRSQSAFDSLRADLNGTGLGLVALGATDSHRSDQQDQSQRLDELMRSMASKESVHRETVERLEGQLAALQKQHDELAVLSRDQVLNASNEVDRLREEKDATETGRIALERDLAAKSAEVERLQDELAATATRAEEAAKEALVKLEAEVAIAKEAAEAGELFRHALAGTVADILFLQLIASISSHSLPNTRLPSTSSRPATHQPFAMRPPHTRQSCVPRTRCTSLPLMSSPLNTQKPFDNGTCSTAKTCRPSLTLPTPTRSVRSMRCWTGSTSSRRSSMRSRRRVKRTLRRLSRSCPPSTPRPSRSSSRWRHRNGKLSKTGTRPPSTSFEPTTPAPSASSRRDTPPHYRLSKKSVTLAFDKLSTTMRISPRSMMPRQTLQAPTSSRLDERMRTSSSG